MASTKKQLRDEFSRRRAERSPFEREQAAADLAEWMYSAPFRLEYDVTVAAYIPVGTEPGSSAMLDALVDRGVTVLLPIVADGGPAPLDWARYDGEESLATRRWGLLEPTGPTLGANALGAASVVLMPAVAVDRRGTRLGRGAGYYDRSVSEISAELVAIVYDEEVVEELPAEDHDVRMGWVLTPGGGFRQLPDL